MPLCSFTDPFGVYDVTPLENLFIEEYMPHANGDFVRVYLYGLKQCFYPGQDDASVATFARTLGMEESAVESAFAYWERLGLLNKVSARPLRFTYNNLKELLFNRKSAAQDDLPYREFNNALQDIFDKKILQASDYERFYALTEGLNLPGEVVLLLTGYVLGKMRITEKTQTRTLVAAVEKEARLWAKQGITSVPLAEAHLHTMTVCYEGAARVLKQFGLRRAPTVDEELLFRKWTEEWGYQMDVILLACRETTKISNPNFSYVDAVLRAKYNQNLRTGEDIAVAEQARESTFSPVKEVLAALGQPSASPTEDLAAQYAGWLQKGFAPECVVMAARQALRRGGRSFNDVERLLGAWAAEELFTPAAVESYLARAKEQTAALTRIFAELGVTRLPTRADKALYAAWAKRGASMELMLLAATYSRHADNPLTYMDKVLTGWLNDGAADPAAAKLAHEQRRAGLAATAQLAAASMRPSKEVSAHRVEQRQYTQSEMEALYTDLDQLLSKEDSL